MELLKIVLLFNIYLHFIIFTIYCSDHRLPRPLEDDDYKALYKSLEENKIETKRNYDARTKRVYRLVRSGKYKLQTMMDPITSVEETKIVSQ